MPAPNYCVECGEQLIRKGWRRFWRSRFCEPCARRLGGFTRFRPQTIALGIGLAAFSLGRYLRPAPPPLIIERAANSPLTDVPATVAANQPANFTAAAANQSANAAEEVYLCGARTRKGTPCRRRVHAAGERCFQHQGLPAMVPLEKLVVKPGAK